MEEITDNDHPSKILIKKLVELLNKESNGDKELIYMVVISNYLNMIMNDCRTYKEIKYTLERHCKEMKLNAKKILDKNKAITIN